MKKKNVSLEKELRRIKKIMDSPIIGVTLFIDLKGNISIDLVYRVDKTKEREQGSDDDGIDSDGVECVPYAKIKDKSFNKPKKLDGVGKTYIS